MAHKIEQNEMSFLGAAHQVINVEKAIKKNKPMFDNMDASVDVVSLHNLKQQISKDNRFNKAEKQNLKVIVDYICD